MKRILLITTIACLSVNLFAQNGRTDIYTLLSNNQVILVFESSIIDKASPWRLNPIGWEKYGPKVYSQYDDNMRTIQWDEPLSRSYLYSSMAFDTLGYEALVLNENTDTKTYRNCFKGITIEVKEYEGQLSITMNWFPSNLRDGIGYLSSCSELIGAWQQLKDASQMFIIFTSGAGNFLFQYRLDSGYRQGGQIVYSFFPIVPIPLRWKNKFEPFKKENTLESYSPLFKIELTYNASTHHINFPKDGVPTEYIKHK